MNTTIRNNQLNSIIARALHLHLLANKGDLSTNSMRIYLDANYLGKKLDINKLLHFSDSDFIEDLLDIAEYAIMNYGNNAIMTRKHVPKCGYVDAE